MPVVAPERPGQQQPRVVVVVALGGLDRPAVLVDALGPRHRDVRLGGDQLAIRAVEDVEEAILRRLHDDLAHHAAEVDLGQHQVLHRGVVPVVTGRSLEVPDQLSRIGAHRQDR
jgi:hypothetical protein